MTTDNFSFYLQNRLIQTNETEGQQYCDTSPFSIPCIFASEALTHPHPPSVGKIQICKYNTLPIKSSQVQIL